MFNLSRGGMFIRINLKERRLYLYQGENLYGSYPIAIGKPTTPSPVGLWSIANKAILNGRQVYGSRWMGLSKPTYGIHGTNNPNSIGKAVSLGCIRMHNHDVEHIFTLIPIGTEVEITHGLQGGSNNPKPPGNKPAEVSPGPGQNPNPSSSKTYIIKKGDTLWSIAQRLGLKLEDLISINSHIKPEQLYPGQEIKLP